MMNRILETERLMLRQIRADDLDAIAEMNGDPGVMKYIGDGSTMNRAESAAFMERLVRLWDLRGFGMYAVEHKASGVFMGLVGLHQPESQNEPELGWRMLPKFQGQGFAFEAADKVRSHMFEATGLHAIRHLIQAGNNASIALAKKLGAVFDRQEMIGGDLECVYITRAPSHTPEALAPNILAPRP